MPAGASRFKVDENLPAEVVDLLKDGGHDAVTVGDQGMSGRPDGEVEAVCRREARAILTLDLGFGDIRAYPPDRSAGIVVLRLVRQDRDKVLAVVRRLMPTIGREPLVGRLWIVDESSTRIRG